MSAHQKTNPTHGTKVTPHPPDSKAEHAGPVPSDSLAADSLRTGGSFAAGPNAAGISGASGASGTFAAEPLDQQGVKTLHGKGEDHARGLGRPGDQVKTKAGQTGTVRGGAGTGEMGPHGKGADTSREHDSARGSTHSGGSSSSGGGTSTQQKTSTATKDQASGGSSHGSGGGGAMAPLNTATNANAFIGGTGNKSGETGKVGDSAEDVDWSKISKDTHTTTDIGGEDDPGRLAERGMYQKVMTHGGRDTGAEDNTYGTLEEENI